MNAIKKDGTKGDCNLSVNDVGSRQTAFCVEVKRGGVRTHIFNSSTGCVHLFVK